MTTNDKPVCFQLRLLLDDNTWGCWLSWDSSDGRERRISVLDDGCVYETRELYARPQRAAQETPDGWALVEKGIVSQEAANAGAKAIEICRRIGASDEVTALSVFSDMLVVAGRSSATPPAAPQVPEGMAERVEAALDRIHLGQCIRRVPADPTDPDLVLAEVLAFVKGEPAPFWIATPPAPEQPKAEPPEALLISMAMRLNHGFGLLSGKAQRSMLADMRNLWDEMNGRGFYCAEREGFYVSQLRGEDKPGFCMAEQPKPAGDVEADAARYRWLKQARLCVWAELASVHRNDLDAAIDATRLAAQPAQGEGEK